MTTTNDTPQTIQIALVDIPQPFAVQLPGPLPLTVNPGATLSLPVTFHPTAAGVTTGMARLFAPVAPVSSPNSAETVWVEDGLPAGATPYKATVGLKRAKIYLKLGNAEGALADLKYSINSAPSCPQPYMLRARALRKLGKLDLALADEQKAAKLSRELESSPSGICPEY